jgi:nicotinamide-nucleotide amidase
MVRRSTRRILTAEILSVGSEITVGETRDTNASELARSLTGEGVAVGRITAVPDRLDVVRDAVTGALERSDLVVSTGGLGPTPDDLTREAIAAAWDETPTVDPELERWLRDRWIRLGLPFPEINLKQAWRIPSASIMPNPNGSAPGWYVTRRDGRVAVALPGPPREMRPMWADHALPRLRAHGLGADIAVRTYRLAGIGESQVAEILGEELLRQTDPEVATYARVEAVDVRISASAPAGARSTGRSAREAVDDVAAIVERRLGPYVWATGDTTWSGAIGARLAELGWRAALEESGAGGQVGALFGDAEWLTLVESRRDEPRGGRGILVRARRIREVGRVDVGVAVRVRPRDDRLAVTVAVVTPIREHRETRTTFVGGSIGRARAAITAAAALYGALREPPPRLSDATRSRARRCR